jgi:dTDP-4-amino-4,6-dideoxy-D-galactose acyltransferase
MNEKHEEPCEFMPWDSDVWGFPVARVRGGTLTLDKRRDIDRWCEERGIRCLYFLAAFDDPMTVRCAEDGGFHLVDARMTFQRPTEHLERLVQDARPPWATIRLAVQSDLEPLRQIAAESFLDTRFYFDQHFPREKCGAYFERWLVDSFKGFADLILVADRDGEPVGCATFKVIENGERTARSGLLLVAQNARRRGVARALKMASLDWYAEQQVPTMTVATQARNIATQVLNQRCGFILQSVDLWYHKWYSPPDRDSS